MSIPSQDVYANLTTPLSVIGTGGGGGSLVSTFSTLIVSSMSVYDLTAGYINAGFISSVIGEFDEVACSSISTINMVLDGNILTSAGSALLLNGITIATTSNISSLEDWSFDPAISTLNMNGNSTINNTLLSTLAVDAGKANLTNLVSNTISTNNLVCNDISTITLTAFSTTHVITTISSVVVEAQSGLFSTINGSVFPQVIDAMSTFDTASISSLVVSSINGSQFPQVSPEQLSTFSTFTISSLTNSEIKSPSDILLTPSRYVTASATGITMTSDRGADIGGNAFFRVSTQNGSAGEISLTANPGFAGNYGRIGLTANGGLLGGLVGVGGLIELTANTPIGTLSNATSAIKLSAAGINSYAGAIPAVGSLLGYNFIYGTLGVNLCAGLPPGSIPNVPGTTYLYGTAGVVLNSDVYTTALYPYWNGLTNPADISLNGRNVNVGLGNYVALVNISTAGTITFSNDGRSPAAIIGVSTINGAPYPPPAGSVPANLIVSTLVAALSVSTPSLFVSSINGVEYIPGGVSPDLIVSTLNAAVGISTPEIALGLSTSIVGASDAGDLFILAPSGVNIYGGPAKEPGQLYVAAIDAVSSINGAAYPPTAVVGANLVVSTLNAADGISTARIAIGASNYIQSDKGPNMIIRAEGPGGVEIINATGAPGTLLVANISSVSSINGAAYPPTAAVGANLVVSTLSAANYVATQQVIFDPSTFIINLAEGEMQIHAYDKVEILAEGRNAGTLVVANISSVSSINGAAYPPTAGVPTQIAQAGASVVCNIVGGIEIYTSTNVDLNLYSGLGIYLTATPDGEIVLQKSAAGGSSQLYIDGVGNVNLRAGTAPGINLTYTTGEITLNNKLNVDTTGEILTFPQVAGSNVGQIEGISTINGAAFPPTAVVGANLIVSTLTAAVSVSTPALFVSSVNGAIYPPPSGSSSNGEFSTLVVSSFMSAVDVSALSSLTIGAIGTPQSAELYTRSAVSADLVVSLGVNGASPGNLLIRDTTGAGPAIVDVAQLEHLSSIYTDSTLYLKSFIAGNKAVLDVAALNNVSSVNGAAYPPPAGSVPADLIVSTLVAAVSVSTPALFVSSINGVVPGGSVVGSTIANAGSYIAIDATGAININTPLPGGVGTGINGLVNGSINLASENGAISFIRNADGTEISMDVNGHININASGGNTILLDSNGYITLTGGAPGSVNIVNLSTINSKDINNPIVSTLTANTSVSTQSLFVSSINDAVYPPAALGAPSSISYGASYVSILPDGGIVTQAVAQTYSVTSGNLLTLNSGQNGIYLTDTDQGANMKILGSIDVGATTTGFNLGSVPTSVSSIINVSSINGAVYPPPSPGGSPNGLFSTLAVSSFVTANDVIALSTLVIGDDNVSTSAYFYNRGAGSADTFLSMGKEPTTGVQGVLRVTNTYGAGAATLDVAALTSISSINNNPYNPLPSTFTSLYTSTFFTSSLNGQPINNLNFSSLSINGLGSITLERNPGNLQSAPIFFKTGSETIAQGILEVCKSYAYTDASTRPYSGLLVAAYSTLGAAQPIIAGSILLCPTPNEYVGAPITGNTAGDIIFPLSTLQGVSTINSLPVQPPVWRVGGVDTIINTTITTANVLIAVNTTASGIVARAGQKYLIMGQAQYTAGVGINTIVSWTIARSTAYPPTAANSTNLASGGGLISANIIGTTPYRLSAILTPATYASTSPFSVVDSPPAGTYWYSLWAYSSGASGVTSENVVLSVLQVSA